jgi:hypothetical protein
MELEERDQMINDAAFGRLPDYSTERFYLLAEIQEACRGGIVCLEEMDEGEGPPPPPKDAKKLENPKTSGKGSHYGAGQHEAISLNACSKNLLVYYVIWRTDEAAKMLIDRVARIAYQCSLPNRYTMIAVDILFDAGTTAPEAAQAVAREGIRSLAAVFPETGCISFGLTSNPAAIPALDMVHDRMRWLRRVGVHWTVITWQRSDFLGYFGDANEEVEPEAVSGVMQYFAAVPDVRSWIETACGVDLTPYCGPIVTPSPSSSSCGSGGVRPAVDFDPDKAHAAAQRILDAKQGVRDSIRLQALAFALLSMFMWWYFQRA